MPLLKKISLRFEIIFIIAIKLIILYFLWLLCFSHPIDKALQPTDMATHLFQNLRVVNPS